VIVLIRIDALDDVFALEIQLNELFEDYCVDWDLGKADEDTTNDTFHLGALVPVVATDILNAVSDFGVGLKDILHEVSSIFACNFRDCVLAVKNFLVEVCCIGILEREVTTNEREQDHTTTPNIYLTPVVSLPSNHLRCCVTRRPTGCLQRLTILVGVR